jgi:CBS domain-containing protein
MDAEKQQYLHQRTISDITNKLSKAVVYVDTDSSLEVTCKLLGQNDILAVPILDVKENKFVGIVDIVDIAYFVAFNYEKNHNASESDHVDLFKSVRAFDLLQISDEGKLMYTFSPNTSLDRTFEPFSKGIHRALVTTEGDQKYHILSQTDVVKFLFESGLFDDMFSKLLCDFPSLFLYTSKVTTISADSPAIEGFKQLGRNKFGAVAVMDSNGKLLGNLSASDLRGVAVDFLVKTILRPARNFLQLVQGVDVAPVTTKLDETLGSAVRKMLEHRVHRVWVVDDQGCLDTVVSLTDVCRVFAEYCM